MADRLELVRVTFKSPVRGKQFMEMSDGWKPAFDKSDGTIALARADDDIVLVHWSNIAWLDMKKKSVEEAPGANARIERPPPGSLAEQQAVVHEIRSETDIVKLAPSEGSTWQECEKGAEDGKQRRKR